MGVDLGQSVSSANPWSADTINKYAEALEKIGNLGVGMFKDISNQIKENNKYTLNNTLFENNKWRLQYLAEQRTTSSKTLIVLGVVAAVMIFAFKK